jgi:hypothetical protein
MNSGNFGKAVRSVYKMKLGDSVRVFSLPRFEVKAEPDVPESCSQVPEVPEYKSGTAIMAEQRRAMILAARILRKLHKNIEKQRRRRARLMVEVLPSMVREIKRNA